jgi:MFS family permease
VSRHPRRSLARDRNFLIFWTGQTFAVLGDAFALVAIPLLVLEATGSVARMGLITAVNGAGALLAGLVAGPLVDRLDRRRLMIQCDLGRVVSYGLIPVGWWLLDEPLWLLYGMAFVAAAFGMVFGVGYVTAIATLVDRDRIVEANARLQTTFALSFVVGPMLAGVLSHRYGAGAIAVTAVAYGISAVSLLFVRLRRAAAARPHGAGAGGHLAGFRFLFGEPFFRALTLIFGTYALLSTGTLDLIIFHVREDLGQSENVVGLLFGVASLGAILGGVLIGRLRRRFGFGPLFAGGLILSGAAIAALGLAESVVLVGLVAIVYTFADNVRGITTMSTRQELTPDYLLGRVTAAFWLAFNATGPLGAALVTAAGARFGAPAALVGVGVVAVVLGAITVLTPAGAHHPRLAADYPVEHEVAVTTPLGIDRSPSSPPEAVAAVGATVDHGD